MAKGQSAVHKTGKSCEQETPVPLATSASGAGMARCMLTGLLNNALANGLSGLRTISLPVRELFVSHSQFNSLTPSKLFCFSGIVSANPDTEGFGNS